jgi:membrane protease YdiL (CAAX protease family)
LIKRLLDRINAPETAPPWGVLTAIGAMIAAFASILIGTTIVLPLFETTIAAPLLGWTLAGVFTVVILRLILRRVPDANAALRLDKSLSPLPLVMLFSLGVAIALDLLNYGVTGQFRPSSELLPICQILVDGTSVCASAGNIFAWAIAFILMALVQPIAEEMVFRGVVYPLFRKAMGVGLGLLICALVYGLFHLLAYGSASSDLAAVWYGLIAPFLAGLYFTAVRAYSQSTRAAIIAHIAFGLFAVLKAFTLSG